MDDKIILRYKTNERVLVLLQLLDEIAWDKIRRNSIHRIFYLAEIMYLFIHEDEKNILADCNFSTTASGPFSPLIRSSLIDLLARKYIIEDGEGNIILNKEILHEFNDTQFINWIKVIIYILGIYGEERIYSFVVRDASYEDAMRRNSPTTIDSTNDNKTLQLLNAFRQEFEQTLEDTSNISKKEYLELYFEYVFGQIIKEKLK